MIIVDDVHKRYRTDHGPGKWVLQGVSFTIPPKLNVGLVGCNGAGKSTLLRLIGGIDTPNRGRIERNCRVSWPMGFSGGLQGSLTGRQNAKFVSRIHGHLEDIADRITYIQEFSELGDAFDEPVKTYSSGMRARLQFGLSLAFDFDVYISDEVTATGDAAFREKAISAFKNLADHASLIMVSHGEGTLRQFCTAGIWLDEGRANWFDNINDAPSAYKKKQMNNQLDDLISRYELSDKREQIEVEIEKIKQQQQIMNDLEKGMNGLPSTVEHEYGVRIINEARQRGVQLVGPGQIARLGYMLQPDSIPVLRKHIPPPENRYVDLYDLKRQCTKVESDQ